jgi:membrane fusion protein (multidrug efflux system)
MKKSLRFTLLGVVVLFIGGMIAFRATHDAKAAKSQRQTPVPAVRLASPTVETMTDALQFTGGMAPIQQAGVYSKVTGNLEAVLVNMGQPVNQGQLLAIIDTTELAQQYTQAAATYTNARLQFDRAQELFTKNLGARQELDNAQAAMTVSKANLDNAATRLSYARVTAPFAGVITQRFLDPGAVVTASNATLFTLMDLDSMKVVINVLEKDIPAVTRGKRAVIMVDAFPDRKFDGSVSRSSDAVDPSTRTMAVEIDVPNRDHTLKPGMFANVMLVIGEHPNAVTVPSQAVLSDAKGPYVYTVDGNNTAKRVPVTTGTQQNNRIQVLSGLSGQERVIVVGQQFVKDGGPVNIQS